MKSITIASALRIIHNCAIKYKNNLSHKNILFITQQNGISTFFEAVFLPRNYLHLTGIRTELNSVDFYNMAVRDRLKEQDILFAADGTTDLKLCALPTLMRIHQTARMVGNYDYSKSLLITEKIAGTVAAAIGFRKKNECDNSLFIPNTALSIDMRQIIQKPIQRIVAMFIKKQQDEFYHELTYLAKGLTLNDELIRPVLKARVDMNKLSASFTIPQ